MLVHSCRCIFLFVMIGFYYKRKELQKLFEDVFGKFEIEKEKKKCPLLSFRPEGLLLPRLAHTASAAASPALLPRAATGRPSSQPAEARNALPSLRIAAKSGPRVSGILFHLPLVTEPDAIDGVCLLPDLRLPCTAPRALSQIAAGAAACSTILFAATTIVLSL
jgi:hypothetical protein